MSNVSAIDARELRERLVEYFEAVTEYPASRGACDLNCIINDWEMIVDSHIRARDFPRPPYTDPEVAAVLAVDAAREAFCAATPQTLQDEARWLALPEWAALKAACVEAAYAYRRASSEKTRRGDT